MSESYGKFANSKRNYVFVLSIFIYNFRFRRLSFQIPDHWIGWQWEELHFAQLHRKQM